MRFKKFEHYKFYNINIDLDYDADDNIKTGFIYKLRTPEFKKVDKSEYGKNSLQKRSF